VEELRRLTGESPPEGLEGACRGGAGAPDRGKPHPRAWRAPAAGGAGAGAPKCGGASRRRWGAPTMST